MIARNIHYDPPFERLLKYILQRPSFESVDFRFQRNIHILRLRQSPSHYQLQGMKTRNKINTWYLLSFHLSHVQAKLLTLAHLEKRVPVSSLKSSSVASRRRRPELLLMTLSIRNENSPNEFASRAGFTITLNRLKWPPSRFNATWLYVMISGMSLQLCSSHGSVRIHRLRTVQNG